jgi:predicted RNA-binding protein YlxR (DUF448 family)
MDPTGRAPGRGAYVCRTSDCLDKAIIKGALSRALRTPLPADLPERVADGRADDVTSTIEGGAHGQE